MTIYTMGLIAIAIFAVVVMLEYKQLKKENPLLIVLGGTSGSGKTVTTEKAYGQESLILGLTSRDMRPGEVNGELYGFHTEEEMLQLKNEGKLLNFNLYRENFYGYSQASFEEKMEMFGFGFIISTVDTRQEFVDRFDAKTIFFKADYKDIEQNITERGDSEEEKAKRLSLFGAETKKEVEYDFVITNKRGSLDETVLIFKKTVQRIKSNHKKDLFQRAFLNVLSADSKIKQAESHYYS